MTTISIIVAVVSLVLILFEMRRSNRKYIHYTPLMIGVVIVIIILILNKM